MSHVFHLQVGYSLNAWGACVDINECTQPGSLEYCG